MSVPPPLADESRLCGYANGAILRYDTLRLQGLWRKYNG